MGRKTGIRGRPGLLFLTLVVIFIIIFILSWRTMRTPESPEVQEIYSAVHIDALRRQAQGNQINPPNFNDFQNGGKGLYNQDNMEDKDYNFGNDIMFDSVKPNKGIDSHEASSKSKIDQSPLTNLLHPGGSKGEKQVGEDKNCKPAVAEEPYYHEPDPSSASVLKPLPRLVHLDLKGAPSKLSYYKELFPLLAKLGATGLLIEYEDMFPYSGDLKNISAANSYSPQEIEQIWTLAGQNNLFVIPIIQTFGHMEFVLKSLHLKELRESDYTPQVINVASKRSYEIIRGMVKQVLAAHPSAIHLHIGCDEVYELGKGKSADIIIKERIKAEHVFVRHVKKVAEIVAEESKGKVRPIIWDDELRNMDESIILDSGIPSHVDIMVWKYTTNISKVLNESLWIKYGKLFKSVWAASSFKGATGPRQIYTEVAHHVQNHFSWIETILKYKDHVHFQGIVLTGWSRFDHFATLCELFPVAIPSLAVCLASLIHGGFNKDIHRETSKLLECSGLIEMSFPALDPKTKKATVTQDCRFPGHMLYYGVQELWGCHQQGQESKQLGWMSDYQISHRFTNPGQLKVMAMKLAQQQANYLKISTPLQSELANIYFNDTVDEWMDENVNEQVRHIKVTQEKIKDLLSEIHWERRPLKGAVRLPAGVKINVNANLLSPQQGSRVVNGAHEERQRGVPGQPETHNNLNVQSRSVATAAQENRQRGIPGQPETYNFNPQSRSVATAAQEQRQRGVPGQPETHDNFNPQSRSVVSAAQENRQRGVPGQPETHNNLNPQSRSVATAAQENRQRGVPGQPEIHDTSDAQSRNGMHVEHENGQRGVPGQPETHNFNHQSDSFKQHFQGNQNNINQASDLKKFLLKNGQIGSGQRSQFAANYASAQDGKSLNMGTSDLSRPNIHGPRDSPINDERKALINNNDNVKEDIDNNKPVLPNHHISASSKEVLSKPGEHNVQREVFEPKDSEVLKNNVRENGIQRDNFESGLHNNPHKSHAQDLAQEDNLDKHDIIVPLGRDGVPLDEPLGGVENSGPRGINRNFENENNFNSDFDDQRPDVKEEDAENVKLPNKKSGEFPLLADGKDDDMLLDEGQHDDGDSNLPYEDKGGLTPEFVKALRKIHNAR